MATYSAIAAISNAIVGLLFDARDTFKPAPAPTVELFHAADFESASSKFGFPAGVGVSLYLYRADLNPTLRSAGVQVRLDGKSYLPPLPVDLHFLLTPWATDVDKQQRLLGWCMRTLHDAQILPGSLINDYAKGDLPFRPQETVELVLETLSFQDMMTLADRLKPGKSHTSVSYLVRMVMLESEIEQAQGAPVQTRQFKRELVVAGGHS